MIQPHLARCVTLAGIALLSTSYAHSSSTESSTPTREYQIQIEADFSQVAHGDMHTECTPVTVEVTQNQRVLRELRWRAPASYQDFDAEPQLTQEHDEWVWRLGASGGTLR